MPAGPVGWDDLFLGQVALEPGRLGGDFVVARNGLGPSYQLAVVVDDALMGVNQVIRGDDLVPSTPRQILLYRPGWAPAVRPRPPGRRARRPSAGQARRLDQAGDAARAGRRSAAVGRIAGPVVRLVGNGRADVAGGMDRSVRSAVAVSRALGGQPGMARLDWRLSDQNRLSRYGRGSRKGS